MKIVKLETDEAKDVEQRLKENGGFCPCRLQRNPDTICMCKEFRYQIKDPNWFGKCHCGLYEKVKE